MNAQYRHSQPGYLMVVFGIVMLTAAGIVLIFAPKPISIVIGTILAVTALLVFNFYKLTIEIKNGFLKFWFGIGIFFKKIPLEQIAYCEPYKGVIFGWGIHWCPSGWLYNVSGMKAVTVALQSGKRMYIGTDEPQQLIESVNLAIHGRTPDEADRMWIEAKADYINRIEQALSINRHPQSFEILAEVSKHLEQRFAELAPSQRTWEDFQKIITEMGPPAEYAELVSEGKKTSKWKLSWFEMGTIGVLLVMFGISAYFYPQMPQIMATQWDFHGNVSGTMPKVMGIFFAPVLLACFATVLIVIPRVVSVSVNIEGFKRFFGAIVILSSIIMSIAQCHIILWNLGIIKSSPNWIVVPLAGVVIAFFLFRYYEISRR
jgi:hypothetical protein